MLKLPLNVSPTIADFHAAQAANASADRAQADADAKAIDAAIAEIGKLKSELAAAIRTTSVIAQ
jgi:hypothetical protein